MASSSDGDSRAAHRIPRRSRRRRVARDAPPRDGPRRDRDPAGRSGPPRGRDAAMSSGSEALDRFLLGLRARDASEHTVRSYSGSIETYLAWLDARGVGWQSPGRADLRAYLGHLGAGGARSTVGQRLAAIRSFHRYAVRAGLAPGDPWGAIGTPRASRRLPRVLEVDQIERLLAA